MGRVLVEIAVTPRAWPALPAALLTAARLPPISAPLPPPRPPRPLEPDRAAARARLAGFDALAVHAERLRIALVGDDPDAPPAAADDVVALRPEDWREVLDAAAPQVLVMTAPRGPGGAWRYHIGWYAHPDSLLQRDVRALLGWCAERAVPAIFRDPGGPDGIRGFAATAALCDLIVAADPGPPPPTRPCRTGAAPASSCGTPREGRSASACAPAWSPRRPAPRERGPARGLPLLAGRPQPHERLVDLGPGGGRDPARRAARACHGAPPLPGAPAAHHRSTPRSRSGSTWSSRPACGATCRAPACTSRWRST